MPGSVPVPPLDVAVQIPYHFRCPISLELMRDPVTVTTGQTYDRASIESWVATGNATCPVTRQPLSDFSLIPNHTLRRLIQEWCVANRSRGVERIPTPKQPADPSLIQTLLCQAASVTSPYPVRIAALHRLKSLAKESEKNRVIISTLPHSRSTLVSISFAASDSGDGSTPESNELAELAEEAISVLVLFTLTESECASIASQSTRLAFLSSLLSHPSLEVRVNAAGLIENLARSPEFRVKIGETDGILTGIVRILQQPLSCPKALKVGIKVLFSLCLVKHNREKAVAAGAAAVLVDRLADSVKCDAERALATIELLCRIPEGCEAFSGHALTVPLLVKIILKISDRATEYAAGALLALCGASEELQIEAVSAGVVTQLLLLVQSDCTERAKRKAQMLLKLLRNAWPEDSIANSDDYICSDVAPF